MIDFHESQRRKGRCGHLRGNESASRYEIHPEQLEEQADGNRCGQVTEKQAPYEADSQRPLEEAYVELETEEGKQDKKKPTRGSSACKGIWPKLTKKSSPGRNRWARIGSPA